MEYAAEDTAFIRAKLVEIEAEKAEARRQRDPDTANGDNLDRIGQDWGEPRQGAESDYTFRNRLLRKIRGEA